ncbi:MAG: hypothetical protein K9J30_09070 [Bacteroidales bacterium]|nr:hypothetical protein [Bacteroidales bacterium]
MPTPASYKRDIIRSIMLKAIELLETALQDHLQALALSESILEAYGTDIDARARLFRDFYNAWKPILGLSLTAASFTDPDSLWPFRIDQATATLMERHIPKTTDRKYQELMEQAFDAFVELDPDNYLLYELFFSGFHLDLFYFAGLRVQQEESQGMNRPPAL